MKDNERLEKIDKLVAKIAPLPITNLSLKYLVEIVSPIHLFPTQIDLKYFEPNVKQEVLNFWKKQFNEIDLSSETDWLLAINDVELIDCDLLVPKEK